MVRLATQWDINQILVRLDKIERGDVMSNYEVVDAELNELRTKVDALIKMADELKAVVQNDAKSDDAKVAEVAKTLDDIGNKIDAALAPKDSGGSTGDVNV